MRSCFFFCGVIENFSKDLVISDEILTFIANEFKSSIRDMLGVLNRIIATSRIQNRIYKIIVEKSTFATKRAKKSIKLAANTSLKKGLKEEEVLFVECFKSNDGNEGIKAFIEKRKPEFKGN